MFSVDMWHSDEGDWSMHPPRPVQLEGLHARLSSAPYLLHEAAVAGLQGP